MLQNYPLPTMPTSLSIKLIKPSASEYAALTLIGVTMAAGAALANKSVALPQILFIAIWLSVLILLSLALTRYVDSAWKSGNLPAKIFAIFSLLIVFFSAVKPTSTGFSRHDEIYSWGMWAVQHALGQSIDLHYTGAAYPQLFSYEISSIFLAQGTHIPHFFAKLIVGLPSLIIIIVLGDFTARSQKSWINWSTLFLSLSAIFSIFSLLYWAYADPLASALLLTSLALLLQYSQGPKHFHLIVLASLCALAASLTKQPGLVWCFVSLPAMGLYGVWRLGWKKSILAPCLSAMIFAAIWPFYLAPTFTSNHGVLEIVKNNGGVIASFIKSSFSYIFKNPDLGLILISPLIFACKNKPIRHLWVFFVLPYLLIWFIFGSYEKRHGIHVILISALLVNYALTQGQQIKNANFNIPEQKILRLNAWLPWASLCLITSSILWAYIQNSDRLRDGNRAIFISQFGDDSVNIFDDITTNRLPIFVASNYQYGIFFNRTTIHRFDAWDNEVSAARLKKFLISSQSAYIFTSGNWTFGPYEKKIEELLKKCPSSFQLSKNSAAEPQLSIYKIHQPSLSKLCNL